jgi:branched-chain amino acid transport system substrate-binding protein
MGFCRLILKGEEMKRKKLTTLLASISLVVILVTMTFVGACAQPAPVPTTTEPIKIGLLVAQTGPFAALGAGVLNGFKLAMDEADNKVAGRSIELVIEDEGPGEPAFALDKARKMVEADNIKIMVGPLSATTRMPVLSYTSPRKIPNICAILDASGAVKFPYEYAPISTVYSQPRPLAWFAYDEKGVRTVTAIASEWEAGHDFLAGFTYGFTDERKGSVLQEQYTAFGTPDYSSYLVAMKDADAIVAMMLPPDIAPFIVQANQMGILNKKPLYLLGSSVLPVMLADLGPMLIGRAWSVPEYQLFYDSPANKNFITAYQTKYGAPPDSFGANGYTRGQMVLAALEANGGDTDPDKLHEAIKGLKLETPQGPISFTPGNPDKSGVQGITTGFIEEVEQVDNQYVWSLIKTYKNVEPITKP